MLTTNDVAKVYDAILTIPGMSKILVLTWLKFSHVFVAIILPFIFIEASDFAISEHENVVLWKTKK